MVIGITDTLSLAAPGGAVIPPPEGVLWPSTMRCLTPRKAYLTNSSLGTGLWQNTRCGYCRNCRITKQASWIVRLWGESLHSEFVRFITLTFRPENYPQEYSVRPLQLFLKRLRKPFPGKIRYFCVGELGSKTSRFHYHGILFISHTQSKLCPIDQSVLENAWDNGFVSIFDVARNMSSFRYVTKYCWKRHDELAMTVMSRKPGIGYTSFFNLGQSWAKSAGDDAPPLPFYCHIAGRTYPIDDTAAAYIAAGFHSVTGRILTRSPSPITTDLQLRAETVLDALPLRGVPVTLLSNG